eukprot:14587333-Alexandrium_andersonii.AAC.1
MRGGLSDSNVQVMQMPSRARATANAISRARARWLQGYPTGSPAQHPGSRPRLPTSLRPPT